MLILARWILNQWNGGRATGCNIYLFIYTPAHLLWSNEIDPSVHERVFSPKVHALGIEALKSQLRSPTCIMGARDYHNILSQECLHVVTHQMLWTLLCSCFWKLLVITGRSCHKYHFCRDKSFCHFCCGKHVCCDKTRLLSQQKYACCDKRTFVTTKDMFCRDSFIMTKLCLSQQVLLWQKYVCCNKRRVLSRQKW